MFIFDFTVLLQQITQLIEIYPFDVQKRSWHGSCIAVGMEARYGSGAPNQQEPTMFTTSFATARTAIAAVGTLFFAGVCLIGATAPAAAAPVARTAMVAYSDLNLASASGRNVLDSRINRAARSVCFDGSKDVASKMAADRCIKAAKADAKAQVYPVTASVTGN
jgi:UrcA family protein